MRESSTEAVLQELFQVQPRLMETPVWGVRSTLTIKCFGVVLGSSLIFEISFHKKLFFFLLSDQKQYIYSITKFMLIVIV